MFASWDVLFLQITIKCKEKNTQNFQPKIQTFADESNFEVIFKTHFLLFAKFHRLCSRFGRSLSLLFLILNDCIAVLFVKKRRTQRMKEQKMDVYEMYYIRKTDFWKNDLKRTIHVGHFSGEWFGLYFEFRRNKRFSISDNYSRWKFSQNTLKVSLSHFT